MFTQAKQIFIYLSHSSNESNAIRQNRERTGLIPYKVITKKHELNAFGTALNDLEACPINKSGNLGA